MTVRDEAWFSSPESSEKGCVLRGGRLDGTGMRDGLGSGGRGMFTASPL